MKSNYYQIMIVLFMMSLISGCANKSVEELPLYIDGNIYMGAPETIQYENNNIKVNARIPVVRGCRDQEQEKDLNESIKQNILKKIEKVEKAKNKQELSIDYTVKNTESILSFVVNIKQSGEAGTNYKEDYYNVNHVGENITSLDHIVKYSDEDTYWDAFISEIKKQAEGKVSEDTIDELSIFDAEHDFYIEHDQIVVVFYNGNLSTDKIEVSVPFQDVENIFNAIIKIKSLDTITINEQKVPRKQNLYITTAGTLVLPVEEICGLLNNAVIKEDGKYNIYKSGEENYQISIDPNKNAYFDYDDFNRVEAIEEKDGQLFASIDFFENAFYCTFYIGEIDGYKKLSKTEKPQNSIIYSVTREQAGLDYIQKLKYSLKNLNSHIQELLNYSDRYKDQDFVEGIELHDDYIILNKYYENEILSGIKIGDSIMQIKKVLGTPMDEEDYQNAIYYKCKDFYIGFCGKKKLKKAFIVKYNPQPSGKALEEILKFLYEDGGLPDERIDFFDDYSEYHFLKAVGYACENSRGIWIQDMYDDAESCINIYNNFEGDLFNYNLPDKYKVIFLNTDNVVENMSASISTYDRYNEYFENESILSSNGKFKLICPDGYYIVRTMDRSKPDFLLVGNCIEKYWLSDDYFLSYDFGHYESDKENLFLTTITDQEDKYQYSYQKFQKVLNQSGLKNISVKKHIPKSSTIVLVSNETHKEVIVKYFFDKNREIYFQIK